METSKRESDESARTVTQYETGIAQKLKLEYKIWKHNTHLFHTVY